MINFYKENGVGTIQFASGDVVELLGRVSVTVDNTTNQIIIAEDGRNKYWISTAGTLQVNGSNITGTNQQKAGLIAPVFQSDAAAQTTDASQLTGTLPDTVLSSNVVLANSGNVTATGQPSKPSKYVLKGIDHTANNYSLSLIDDLNRLVASFDNTGRMDVNDYSGQGSVAVLRNFAASVANLVAGHYAMAAKNSAGNLNTIGYFQATVVDPTATAFSSNVLIAYTDALDQSPGYSQPNKFINISSGGFQLPDIPLKAQSGVLNLGNKVYISSVGMAIGTSTGPLFANQPFKVSVGNDKILRILDSTDLSIQVLNDAEGAFKNLRIDCASILLNTAGTNGKIGVGVVSPNTILHTSSFATAFAAKTAAYTVSATDHTITGDATTAAFIITLPTAASIAGREYIIKKIDASANAVTVATTSSQTIDGATTFALPTQWKYVKVKSTGTNWIIIGNN